MDDVVVRDDDPSRISRSADLAVVRVLGDDVRVLRSRHHAGRPHLQRRVLRIVERHEPAGVMPPARERVLVQRLALAVGLVKVDESMRFEVVVVPHDARERPARHRVVVQQLEFRDSWQEVVAGVPLSLKQVIDLGEHLIVELTGQVGPHDDIAVADERPHLVVREPDRVHGVPPSVG